MEIGAVKGTCKWSKSILSAIEMTYLNKSQEKNQEDGNFLLKIETTEYMFQLPIYEGLSIQIAIRLFNENDDISGNILNDT